MLSCFGTLCPGLPPTRWITRSYKKSPPRARVKLNSSSLPDILLQRVLLRRKSTRVVRPQFGAAVGICVWHLALVVLVVFPVRMPTHASMQDKPTETSLLPAAFSEPGAVNEPVGALERDQ